jgi:hypothetical protein
MYCLMAKVDNVPCPGSDQGESCVVFTPQAALWRSRRGNCAFKSIRSGKAVVKDHKRVNPLKAAKRAAAGG